MTIDKKAPDSLFQYPMRPKALASFVLMAFFLCYIIFTVFPLAFWFERIFAGIGLTLFIFFSKWFLALNKDKNIRFYPVKAQCGAACIFFVIITSLCLFVLYEETAAVVSLKNTMRQTERINVRYFRDGKYVNINVNLEDTSRIKDIYNELRMFSPGHQLEYIPVEVYFYTENGKTTQAATIYNKYPQDVFFSVNGLFIHYEIFAPNFLSLFPDLSGVAE